MDSLRGAMVSLLESIYPQRNQRTPQGNCWFPNRKQRTPGEEMRYWLRKSVVFHMEINWPLNRINVFLDKIIVFLE